MKLAAPIIAAIMLLLSGCTSPVVDTRKAFLEDAIEINSLILDSAYGLGKTMESYTNRKISAEDASTLAQSYSVWAMKLWHTLTNKHAPENAPHYADITMKQREAAMSLHRAAHNYSLAAYYHNNATLQESYMNEGVGHMADLWRHVKISIVKVNNAAKELVRD